MYDETNVPAPEYRVRAVVRYSVTRYCHPYQSKDGRVGGTGHSEVVAEVPSEKRAYEIAQALSRVENENFGVETTISA